MPEPDSIPSEQQAWLAIRDEHIVQLEGQAAVLRQQLRDATTAFQKANEQRQLQEAELTASRQQQVELQQSAQQWREHYEQLRIQKGGFGLKALAATGLAGLVLGLLVYRIFFYHPDAHARAFDQFRKDAGFQVEYSLNQRQIDKANAILQQQMARSEYAPIHEELDFMSSMVGAVQRAYADTAQSGAGNLQYAIHPASGDTALLIKPQRQLTITEDAAIIHVEASFKSGVLVALKKKEKINQWDQTTATDKIKVLRNGIRGTAEDYWYEVETADGYKGWLFGYYTNASLKRFKPDTTASNLTKLDTIAKKDPKQPVSAQ